MKIHLISFLLLLMVNATSQNPMLVGDINPGSENAVEHYGTASLQNGDDIYFIANTASNLSSLFLVRDGQLLKLKECKANSPLVLFKDKVIFVAKDGTLWSADGPTTSMVLDQGLTNVDGIIVGADNNLYFTSSAKLYVSDGNAANTIIYSFSSLSIPATKNDVSNIIPYGQGVAFTVVSSDNNARIITIAGAKVDTIATIDAYVSYTKHFSLQRVENGLVFVMQNTAYSQVDGLYYFNEQTKLTSKIALPSGNEVMRISDFLPNKPLVALSSSGYYTLSGEPLKLVKITSKWNSLVSGTNIPIAVSGNQALFYTEDFNTFGKYIIATDGTLAGTKEIKLSKPYPSNLFANANKVFFAEGTSNGYEPTLEYYDLNTKSLITIKSFTESSLYLNSIMIIGIVGSKMYYFSNLDETYGRELYSIETGINTSYSIINNDNYKIECSNNHFNVINTNYSQDQISVQIYDILGRLIDQRETETNTINTLNTSQPILIFKIRGIGMSEVNSVKVLNVR